MAEHASNELVGFLASEAPARLNTLRDSVPGELRHILDPGTINLGKTVGDGTSASTLAQVDIALAVVQPLVRRADKAREHIRARAKRLLRASRVLDVVTAVSSLVPLFTAIFAGNARVVLILSSGFTALVGLFSVVQKSQQGTNSGGKSWIELWRSFEENYAEFSYASEELRALRDQEGSDQLLLAKVGQMNGVMRTLRALIAETELYQAGT